VSYEIDVLKVEDVEESVKLLQMLGRGVSPVSLDPQILGRTLHGSHAITLVAKEEGKIVGVIYGTATMTPNIVLLATKPSENLGSMLVDKFVDHVRNQLPSANAVRTSLPADMPQVVAFYSSKAFVVEGFVKAGFQGRDLVFLQKALTRKTTPVV
jgi:hypothetical protein